jgi:SAM-dependent methyltransferase
MSIPDDVLRHYEGGVEKGRLEQGAGLVERDRTRDIVLRHAPGPPAVVLDVGGGPGSYAAWLLERGYEVHLVDLTPRHVDEARSALAAVAAAGGWSASLGDARGLEAASESVDVVLLFGPLYHLTEREDRLSALGEARRVLKRGGLLLAAGISRFASVLDGMARNLLDDPEFVRVVDRDLQDGVHENPTGHPEYFATAFFHRPEELRAELTQAGFVVDEVVGLEGPTWLFADIGERWANDTRRATLLAHLRRIEKEPALSGLSAHLVAVGKKPS